MNLPSRSSPTAPTNAVSQAEPGRAAGGDRRRAADHERARLDQLLALPELGHDVAAAEQQIRVAVAHHEQVEHDRRLAYEREQLGEPPLRLAAEERAPRLGVHA